MGQQLAQGLRRELLPPGVLPPGLHPRPAPATPVAPQPVAVPRFKGYIILGQQPLMNADVKDEMLDVFGSEDSFGSNRGNCFYPEMGVAFVRQDEPRSSCSCLSSATRRRWTARCGRTRRATGSPPRPRSA